MNEQAQCFRLSPQQRRLFWLSRQGSPIHAAHVALHLRGVVRPEILREALARLVGRHPILQTAFRRPSGMRLPVQAVGGPWQPELQRLDLGELAPRQRDDRVAELWSAGMGSRADLETGPPLAATLVRLSADDHLLLVTLHPLCADGRTLDNLVAEMGESYAAALDGKPPRTPAFPYVQFSDWQNALLEEDDDEDALRELRQKRAATSTAGPTLPWQIEPPLPPDDREPDAGPVVLELSAVESGRLESAAERCRSSLATFLLACWQALLWRLTEQQDITVTEVYDFRTEDVLADAFGLFAKCLPVTARLQPDLRFTEWLANVDRERAAAQELADGFFWDGSQELNRGEARPIPVGFEHSAWPEQDVAGGVTFSLSNRRACVDDFHLELCAITGPRGVRCELHGRADRFRRADLEWLATRLATLLNNAVDRPETSLADLDVMSEGERRQVTVDGNRTAQDFGEGSIVQRFARVAAERPDETAVRVEDRSANYRELNARANQLAWCLRGMGIGPDIPAALCVGRSVEMLVGMLGILKAGGAYVPLDPEQPARRLAYVLEDTAAPLLLTQQSLRDLLPPTAAKVLCLDAEDERLAGCRMDDPPPVADGANLAYIVFTSGSTGRPKGVAVEHRQLWNYVQSAIERLGFPSAASFATVSTFAADLGNTMLFPALLTGGRLHIMTQARASDPTALADYFRRHGIDCLKIVPSHLETLLDSPDPGSVLPRQRLVLGGEALPWALLATVARLAPECRVYNHYGPSETTVGVAVWPAAEGTRDPRCATVPIGRPLPNTEIHLLDDRLRSVPFWAAGELYVGGANVTRGYLGRPDLTAASFLPDPLSGRPGARLYRTGDLARRLPDGAIEFLGRRDHQIKLHGYRIELGEIRAALNEHPQVRDSIIVPMKDEGGRDVLVAYYVCRQDLETSELRELLRSRIIEPAIPSFFVRLKRLPLTLNGKVNHEALPSLAAIKEQVKRSVVPPRTAIEEIVAGLWTELLGMPAVSAHDNFFELGGHSLLATSLISRLRQTFHVEVPLARVFDAPTVGGLSTWIERAMRTEGGRETPPITPGTSEMLLSFAQERLWFMHQLEPDSPAYNNPAALRVTGALRVPELWRSLAEIVRRHAVLRSTFSSVDGRPLQVVSPAAPPRLWLADLTGLDGEAREREARRLAAAEAARPFDLARGPLLRAGLVKLGEQEHLALFTMHHIVSDAWSMDILVREVTALYNAFITGQPSPLPDLPIQYADFAHWQRQWLAGEVLESQLATWKRRLAGAPEVTTLPADRPYPAVRSLRGGVHYRVLPAGLKAALAELSRREGSTLFMTLLAAFNLLLHGYTGDQDLVVGTDVANRNHLDTEKLIGFFVNNLALRTDLSGSPSWRELIRRVRDVSLEAYAHQDLPFDHVVKALKVKRTLSHTPLFQILFVHQNAPASGLGLHGLRIGRELYGPRTSKFDLAVFIREQADGLLAEWIYSSDLFDAATIEGAALRFEEILQGALASPDAPVSRLAMVSDTERREQTMKELGRQEANLSKLRGFRRRAVETDAPDVIRTGFLAPNQRLPLLVQPAEDDLDLADWAAHNQAFVEDSLLRHGAILFRGFDLRTVKDFERFAQAITPELFAEYGDLPSEEGSRKVYRSTPYPASKTILFHNESSHIHRWPQRQWFFCVTAAQEGGETPIVDCREIYQRLDPEIRERFERKRLLYVRNFIRGFDVSWQDFFRTDSREAVERYCEQAGIEYEWKGEELRTRQVCPAVIRHPRSGEMVFFNQIMLHHVSCLDPEVRESMLSLFHEEDLPRNVYYGDGTVLDDATVRTIYDLYWQTAVAFPWQERDILMVDNALVAHARNPYVGPRKIVVAMGDIHSNRDL